MICTLCITYNLYWVCLGIFFPHHGMFSRSLRFWRPSRSQTKSLTWSRSWATSTPRSTETARKPRSLTWTGDPSLDHLHNTQQVIWMIIVAKETDDGIQAGEGPVALLYHWWLFNGQISDYISNTRPGTHAFFFISRWAGSAIAEANNGRQVFVVHDNWVDVLVQQCLLCADPN